MPPIDADRAPIYETLEKHAQMRVTSYHVPGHKQRAVWQHAEAENRYGPLLPLDLTELADTDDLHHPQGPIEEAQRLAAHCFGAEETRFLVGGSTAGNLAMIVGVCGPGDLLIVQRNIHRSVIHGLMLAGARAVFLPPVVEPKSGLAVIPHPSVLAEAVSRYPEAKGVVLSSPNYYGMTAEMSAIVQICHSDGLPVLVDEAHGAHFGFHPSFPPSALASGADIVVQSTHKILSAMTMGAMLHFQGGLVNREPVRQALRMVQSSSPSFPILASLDLARRQLHLQGAAAFDSALQAVRIVLEGLPQTYFRAVGFGINPADSLLQDPLKLVLYDESGKIDGFQIRDELANRGCIAEMADSRHVVMAFGTGSREADGEALIAALTDFSAVLKDMPLPPRARAETLSQQTDGASPISVPEPVVLVRDLPETVRVPLEQSAGSTAGEWIVPYPPGIPEVFPGERITEQAVRRLLNWRKQGALIQGAEDPSLAFIRIRRF